ncbi:nuclear transport factor 2 family protein [Nocardioides sp. BGMRC 2183]|nr:nuclear transport factor 2 family protein [Nocardioides sp. BGMRC 2183]
MQPATRWRRSAAPPTPAVATRSRPAWCSATSRRRTVPVTDRWEIEHLKYRYASCVDTRDWDGLAATLAPEMVARYRADLATEGADALVAELRSRLTEHRITLHQLQHPVIEVEGDRARATWTMVDRTLCTDLGLVVEGASLSTDTYRRDPERGWLITRIDYRRLYESRAPLPEGFTLVTSPFDAVTGL